MKERHRLSAADWEIAALGVIAESGVQSISIESMARDMKVTKGSFYWHFSTRDALIMAALERWEQEDMTLMTASDVDETNAETKLIKLFQLVGQELPTHSVYSALFLSPEHPIVAPILERVSKRRMRILSTAFRDLGMSDKVARYRARLTYTAYIGFLQLTKQMHGVHLRGDEFEEYMQHLIETLVPVKDCRTLD
ncbi:MAG: TetR/AcrR family transcriptional regulator [bacterium]